MNSVSPVGLLLGFFTFLFSPVFSQSPAQPGCVDIKVTETAGISLRRPLSGGIPFAEGAAPSGSEFVVTGADGKEIPSLATWNDGSVRWVLVDFQADPGAGSTAAWK